MNRIDGLGYRFVETVSENKNLVIAAVSVIMIVGTIFASTDHVNLGAGIILGDLMLGAVGLWIYASLKKQQQLTQEIPLN